MALNTTTRLGPSAVSANTKLASSVITPHALAAGAVSANTKLASGVVTTHALATSAVTTAKITDANITTAKLADSSVTPAKGGTGQNFSTTAQGSTLYFSGTGTVAALAPGTSGQFLKTQGAGANPAWDTVTSVTAATQAEMEAASSTTVFVSPGRQQYHPSALKMWADMRNNAGSPVLDASFNVSSLTDIGTGIWRPNLTTSFSTTADYVAGGTAMDHQYVVMVQYRAAGSFQVRSWMGTGTHHDADGDMVCWAFGDQ